jgi:hypothetical protein
MTTLLLFLVTIATTTLWLSASTVSAFEFDHDVSLDQCRKDINQCTAESNNATMWYSCPISCAEYFELEGCMAEQRTDPEQLYELHAKRSDDVSMSLEENEGYVTLYAVIPMLPGMAQYYYDAVEHIAHIYKYTLVAMILPYYDDDQSTASSPSSSILQSITDNSLGDNNNNNNNNKKKTKSILLEGHQRGGNVPNPVLEYLLSREVVAGNFNLNNNNNESILMTTPNIFLISHTGMFIERMVSPTMEMIERRLKVHLRAMDELSEREL